MDQVRRSETLKPSLVGRGSAIVVVLSELPDDGVLNLWDKSEGGELLPKVGELLNVVKPLLILMHEI